MKRLIQIELSKRAQINLKPEMSPKPASADGFRDPRTKGRYCDSDKECSWYLLESDIPGGANSKCVNHLCQMYGGDGNPIECNEDDFDQAERGTPFDNCQEEIGNGFRAPYRCVAVYTQGDIGTECDTSDLKCTSIVNDFNNAEVRYVCAEDPNQDPGPTFGRCINNDDCVEPVYFVESADGTMVASTYEMVCILGICRLANSWGQCNPEGTGCDAYNSHGLTPPLKCTVEPYGPPHYPSTGFICKPIN